MDYDNRTITKCQDLPKLKRKELWNTQEDRVHDLSQDQE